jgi:hypothetical protein
MGGPGPIPWTAIDQFASRYGFDGDEVAHGDFVFLIQSLDEEYLQMEAERRKKEEQQRGSSQGVRKARPSPRKSGRARR